MHTVGLFFFYCCQFKNSRLSYLLMLSTIFKDVKLITMFFFFLRVLLRAPACVVSYWKCIRSKRKSTIWPLNENSMPKLPNKQCRTKWKNKIWTKIYLFNNWTKTKTINSNTNKENRIFTTKKNSKQTKIN